MDLAELRKRVAEVLGVSASQNELSFEVFTENVSEILTEGITLKVPRVGFFQIKIANAKTKKPQQLLFSSLPEDFTKEARTLYLTIDIYPRIKNPIDFDSQIFSIGVGKPLLPLLDDSVQDSETSFAILRKSIEERVRELIAEADQIPNFNIWEDSFPHEDDELEAKTNLNTQLSELTKDLDITSFSTSEIQKDQDSNVDFLNSLLAQNNFEITDDFSADIEKVMSATNETEIELPPAFDDALFNAQNEFTSPDISLHDLLDDNNPEPFADRLENDSIDSPSILSDDSEEKIDEDVMFGEIVNEELINYEHEDNLKISDLLSDDEIRVTRNEEISIEPPTSTKYLLFDQMEEENKIKNASQNWNIEQEHLQGIVQEELLEYDSDKIADENSRVLNQLLAETKSEIETKKEAKKVVYPPLQNDEPSLHKTLESTNSDIDNDLEDKLIEKIEWNWGDELKEEFGIGNDTQIESKPTTEDEYRFDNEMLPNNDADDVNLPEEPIDPLSEFANKYTSELNNRKEEKFDLRKTRIDLFTRLEKTLEREVTFLKEEFEKPKPVEIQEEVSVSKLLTKEVENPKIDFKDEKVFLDFKTPPPKYEFYEEKEEPILTRPKRITILLSPEDQIPKTSSFGKEPEPVAIEEKIESKKHFFGKAFSIILSTFILVTAIVIYFLFVGKGDNTQATLNQKAAEQKAMQIDEHPNKNTILETAQIDSTNINLDEFSDFPRTATAPVPIKQRNDLSNVNLPILKSPIQNAKQETNKLSTPIKTPLEKVSPQKSDIYKKVQNDVRVNNMIFSDGKTFNFQHSSWRRKDLAEREVARLRDQGLNAFLIEAFLPDKGGMWYRVRIGSFKTEQEAASFMSKNKF